MVKYEENFKEQMIKLHLEEGRTIKSLSDEYHVSTVSIQTWLRNYRKECLEDASKNEEKNQMEEINRLKKELEESKKEIEFLKKAAAFFAKEIN